MLVYFLVLLELASKSRDLLFFPPFSDWYSNCQASQAFLAWYSWQKRKSGSGCSWSTGCALQEYHAFFIFLVVWSLAAEERPPGELDLSSYSMTCSLAAVFLRIGARANWNKLPSAQSLRHTKDRNTRSLALEPLIRSAMDWCVQKLRPQSSPQTSVQNGYSPQSHPREWKSVEDSKLQPRWVMWAELGWDLLVLSRQSKAQIITGQLPKSSICGLKRLRMYKQVSARQQFTYLPFPGGKERRGKRKIE